MILLIDNYDSFVHNLARYLIRLGQQTMVLRNDAIDARAIGDLKPQAIVISPGPCTPREAGISEAVIREFHRTIPVLGVCLGHQAIATSLGGTLRRASEPIHGRTSDITHNGDGLFQNIPSPMQVCRYHSLIIDEATLPGELTVTARTSDGTPMAIAHRDYPLFGVQFHPEAILTEHGYALLANFLTLAGLPVPQQLPNIHDEHDVKATVDEAAFTIPYTF